MAAPNVPLRAVHFIRQLARGVVGDCQIFSLLLVRRWHGVTGCGFFLGERCALVFVSGNRGRGEAAHLLAPDTRAADVYFCHCIVSLLAVGSFINDCVCVCVCVCKPVDVPRTATRHVTKSWSPTPLSWCVCFPLVSRCGTSGSYGD